MKIDDIKKICVVGAGNMGHQIATLCALQGFQTTCTDIDQTPSTRPPRLRINTCPAGSPKEN